MNCAVDKSMPDAHFESLYKMEGRYWWHQTRLAIATSLLSSKTEKHESLLDLGCGTGGFMLGMAKSLNIHTLVGVDSSPTAIMYGKKNNVEVFQADLLKPLHPPGAPFDIITAMDVMEHLPHEQPLLASARENLKPQGLLLIAVPALPFLYSSWDQQLGHYRRYTKKSLLSLLQAQDFSILRCTHGFSFPLVPALFRRLAGSKYNEQSTVFPPVSPRMNRLLLACGRIEARILHFMDLPLGLSLYALCQAPP